MMMDNMMIVIDEHTDSTLVKALETYRAKPDSTRYIYFKFAGKNIATSSLPEFIGRMIPIAGQQMYLCEDGDVFILAPMMQAQEARELIAAVSKHSGIELTAELVEFNELHLHINRLLVLMENKLEKKRQLLAAKQKEQQQSLAKQKKQEILTIKTAPDVAEKVIQTRQNRREPEIMIIEDDAFSRRLVDNVLNKQYKLTGLGEADAALSTYIRLAPDVLFLDINLPDVTGHELLEKIIQIDPAAYVIMLSGNCDRASIMQAMGHGAKGFIAKPFTREKLFQYIDRCPTLRH
jgi:two-component system chemotaxis response regulator CheY